MNVLWTISINKSIVRLFQSSLLNMNSPWGFPRISQLRVMDFLVSVWQMNNFQCQGKPCHLQWTIYLISSSLKEVSDTRLQHCHLLGQEVPTGLTMATESGGTSAACLYVKQPITYWKNACHAHLRSKGIRCTKIHCNFSKTVRSVLFYKSFSKWKPTTIPSPDFVYTNTLPSACFPDYKHST